MFMIMLHHAGDYDRAQFLHGVRSVSLCCDSLLMMCITIFADDDDDVYYYCITARDDDDDVYYYIRWRLKLEGETENMGVCTKERKMMMMFITIFAGD